MGLGTLVSNKEITSTFQSPVLEKLLNNIFLLLNKQKILETEMLNAKNKEEIDCKFVDEDTADVNDQQNSNIFSDSEDEESAFKIKINMEKLNQKVKEELIEEQISESINLHVILLNILE